MMEEPPTGKQGDPETLPKYFYRVDDGPPIQKQVEHVFPGAKGRIVLHEKGDRVIIATEKFISSVKDSEFHVLSSSRSSNERP